MKALNYKWLLVFFMLWLPLQGATAAILSVCVQEKNSNRHVEKSVVAIDSHHHEGCQKQAADNGHHVLTSLPCDDASCDAYSNTPIPPGQTVLTLPIPSLAISSLCSSFVSFVPEQPQRPPLPISL